MFYIIITEKYNFSAPKEEQPKKYTVHSDIKTLLGKDCEVEKVMKEIEIFEGVIITLCIFEKINITPAASYSHKRL